MEMELQIYREMALDVSLRDKLPTRETEWSAEYRPLKLEPSYKIKVSSHKMKKIYNAYFEYGMAKPGNMYRSAKYRRQEAHQQGMIAVAYMECRCQECRYLLRDRLPDTWESVLNTFEAVYPDVFATKYHGDDDYFFETSECCVVEAFRDSLAILGKLEDQREYWA
jgi:hypothetical protein